MSKVLVGSFGGKAGGASLAEYPAKIGRAAGDGGGSGMDGYAREADLRELKAKVEATLPHLATKADLSSLESSLIKWFIGTAFAAVGLSSAIAFSIARFLL